MAIIKVTTPKEMVAVRFPEVISDTEFVGGVEGCPCEYFQYEKSDEADEPTPEASPEFFTPAECSEPCRFPRPDTMNSACEKCWNRKLDRVRIYDTETDTFHYADEKN